MYYMLFDFSDSYIGKALVSGAGAPPRLAVHIRGLLSPRIPNFPALVVPGILSETAPDLYTGIVWVDLAMSLIRATVFIVTKKLKQSMVVRVKGCGRLPTSSFVVPAVAGQNASGLRKNKSAFVCPRHTMPTSRSRSAHHLSLPV